MDDENSFKKIKNSSLLQLHAHSIFGMILTVGHTFGPTYTHAHAVTAHCQGL